jgi:hypothetical protein
MKNTVLVLAVALAALAAPASADSAEDDLAVVKQATRASEGPATATATPEAPPRSRSDEPQWLRVRIVEKGRKKATVKVNLPLGLVRAFADDVPVPGCYGHEGDDGERLTIGEVLRALDTGESLVEIDDDDETVRIWVE